MSNRRYPTRPDLALPTGHPARHALTTVEIAAFLGITPSGVRQIIRRHRIKAVGRQGRAHLYDAQRVIRAATPHDRLGPAGQASSQLSH